jgi:OmpA-OmpF porin, OOP family
MSSRAVLRTAAFAVFVITAIAAPTARAGGEGEKCTPFIDIKKNSVKLHPKSFVDRVACHAEECNNPFWSPSWAGGNNVPENVIGPPVEHGMFDFFGPTDHYTLGCDKTAIWEFTDNLIVDVDGPDILIFEGGWFSESTLITISSDRKNWIAVERGEGGLSSIDISKSIKNRSQTFRFIRFTDQCDWGSWSPSAGADVDAIATYGYSWTSTLSSDVVFETGKSDIRNSAELDKLVERVKGSPKPYRLRVVGFTDSMGAPDKNVELSIDRATAVMKYMTRPGKIDPSAVEASGLGEEFPVTSNDTKDGMSKNRRVELTYIPQSPCP